MEQRKTVSYHFYMRDHLGSNRVVASAAGVAEQANHYYPYGSTFYGETTTDHRFKYCGRSALRDAFEATWRKKELDRMHGLDWYDSSARYYDHALGRFHQIDPLAEKYYAWSPYVYCKNNPVNAIDPDGRGGLKVLLKSAYKIGKSVAKNGLSSLGKGATYASAFNDVVDDAITVFDTNASTWDRVYAGGSLLSEVAPISVGDIKMIGVAVKKTYQTYTKTHPLTGKKYVGRTSGKRTPLENIQKRDKNHLKNKEGYGPAVLDKSSDNPDAIYGQEQYQIEHNGGAQSQGGTSGNAINGVGPKNPNREKYEQARKKEFGE